MLSNLQAAEATHWARGRFRSSPDKTHCTSMMDCLVCLPGFSRSVSCLYYTACGRCACCSTGPARQSQRCLPSAPAVGSGSPGLLPGIACTGRCTASSSLQKCGQSAAVCLPERCTCCTACRICRGMLDRTLQDGCLADSTCASSTCHAGMVMDGTGAWAMALEAVRGMLVDLPAPAGKLMSAGRLCARHGTASAQMGRCVAFH